MKFNHPFVLTDDDCYKIYKSDNNIVRLDFLTGAVRVAVYKVGAKMLPTYNIAPNNDMPLCGRDRLSTEGFNTVAPTVKDGKFYLNDSISISVDTNNMLITYYQNGTKLFGDRAPLAYNFENEFGCGSYHYITRDENEKIYGLGDKAGELNKAGNAYRIETADSMGFDAHSTDPLYKHIPFYICQNSVGSYGIFYDTTDTSFMDLGREINNYYEPFKYFKTDDDCLVYYVFFGTKLQILQSFCKLVGKQAFPPKWSFDYCASTMAYTDAPDSEHQMDLFLDKIKQLGLSCSGFYLSSGYTSIGKSRCVFNWNYSKFPNPAEFVAKFNNAGINLIPNIKPAFLTTHPMYNDLAGKGLFVKNEDGTPFIAQFWDGYGSYLDFTNPSAFDFWGEQVTTKLLDLGITCTWNDNNEFDIRDTGAVANSGVNACRIRPALTYLMNASSYQAQIKKRPNYRPFLSTRSGGIAVRRLAQTWSGDNRTAFEDLRYNHYMGLTMSMSGLYFYGHDLGGFYGDMPSRELLLRWLQHGLFEPRFTIHSWNVDGSATMPWSYSDIISSVQNLFKQRRRLLPYLYNSAYNSVKNDVPINAPLFMYYNDDNITDDCNSFMLGRDIIATCVFDEGINDVCAYLPQGDDWYYNDTLYPGGTSLMLNIPPTSTMPLIIRAGSVIPFDDGDCTYGAKQQTVLHIYPVESGTFTAHYFDDDGKTFDYKNGKCVMLDITVDCDKYSVTVTYKNNGTMKFEPKFKLHSNKKLIVK